MGMIATGGASVGQILGGDDSTLKGGGATPSSAMLSRGSIYGFLSFTVSYIFSKLCVKAHFIKSHTRHGGPAGWGGRLKFKLLHPCPHTLERVAQANG